MPDDLKTGVENLSGLDMTDVRVHYNSSAPAQFQANAYAQGTNIHLGPGQERHLPHEAWHVVQQKQGRVSPTLQMKGAPGINDDTQLEHEADVMGAKAQQAGASPATAIQLKTRKLENSGAPIQRNYAGLSSTAKARVDQQADEKYAQKSLDFELGMAPRILNHAVVIDGVDVLMIRVANIVDAWATHTAKTKAVAYVKEFGWPPGDGYYGAFHMTAENINKVLTSKGEPVRKRLKLAYNAVRNNNMSKWLKLAAIELDREAKGKTAKAWKIRTESQRVENGAVVSERADETVTPGFARAAGLHGSIRGDRLTELTDIATREKKVHNPFFGSKRDDFDHQSFSDATGWKPETHKANRERRGNASRGITMGDQRTLERQDLPDITDEEIDQITINNHQAPSGGQRLAFRANANSKTNWTQGGEFYDVELGSESALAANVVKARMEAGISGSTDLMIHAAINLGFTGNILKTLRLALAGWMIANRDHSFYEVLKAAEAYGLAFDATPGNLYSDADNLVPMNEADFDGILPNDAGMNNVFPRSYLQPAYKDHLANQLAAPATTHANLNTALNVAGVPALHTDIMTERESADLTRLSEIVQATVINAGDTPSVKKREVRRIKSSTPYISLGNKWGEKRVEVLLNTLLIHHNAAAGAHNTSDRMKLASAGVPFTILDFASPANITAMEAVRNAVEQAVVGGGGGLVMGPINAAKAGLTLPDLDKERVVSGMIKKYHGIAHLAPNEQSAAGQLERMAQLEMIAATNRTSGTWYSWGDNPMLNGYVAAASLRNATSNVPSAQGPGLYVATKISSSYGYGNQPGQGLLVVIMNNVPTIDRKNPEQMAKIRTLAAGAVGDALDTSGAYKNHIIEMLLFYGANFGRLTTNKGVTLTRDLTKAPADQMRAEFFKLDVGAKNNFRAQAAHYHLDMTGW